ncbi:P-loop NTPase fold protein [Acetobacter estunensis]|uniref:P-loop NTPase fold protein n=1 Tax=Acetobacter estunensis TaxID=104097 RepID=UPI001C2CF7E7|nr:P-loop NTPase fold protein [Acetobacter estunensis]MBV1838535.1 KAP family NTPase [Acetobacter estunensis]
MKSSKYGWAGPNQDLVRTLDDYCYGKDVAPFALMLTGAWGSGKTWLVDRFFEEKKKNRSNDAAAWFPLRVSLFGVASAAEIGDALYAELHPVLAGKPGQVGGFVVRSLLKSTLRIELKDLTEQKGKGKTGGGVTLAGADLSGLGRDGKPRRRIIIFDDLERAKMPVTDILAAIHPLVGSGDNRVVLLVNEKEIAASDKDEEERYRRTKEKTVCLTLEVKPDFASALTGVSAQVKNPVFRAFLEVLARPLQPLVVKTGSSNLRLLLFFAQLGEDLFEGIEPAYRTSKHYAALSELFILVYIALVESRVHGVPFETFRELARTPPQVSRDQRKKEDKTESDADKKRETIKRRLWSYDYAVLHSPLISTEDLESLVMRGTVRVESVNKSLALDSRFTDETKLPSWVRVWNYARSSEQDIDSAVAAFAVDFENRKFSGLEMLHACSLYLTLNRVGQEGFGGDDPVGVAKVYITEAFAKRKPTEEDVRMTGPVNPFFFAPFGRPFSEDDTADLKAVTKFYFAEQEAWLDRGLRLKAVELERLFQNNIDEFIPLLFRAGETAAVYEHTPLLHYLDVTGFSEKIINLPADRRIYFIGCLKERFDRTIHSGNALYPEFAWFHKLNAALGTAVRQSDGSPLFREGLRVTISQLCESVDKIPLPEASNV